MLLLVNHYCLLFGQGQGPGILMRFGNVVKCNLFK